MSASLVDPCTKTFGVLRATAEQRPFQGVVVQGRVKSGGRSSVGYG